MTYKVLDVTSVAQYVSQLASTVFDADAELRGTDLADGNINLVFRVYNRLNPDQSVVVKQALPWLRRFPEMELPPERVTFEHEAMRLQALYVPECVPRVYHFDSQMYLIVMEDLKQHEVMRAGLMRQQVYPRFAGHIGTFLARCSFHTSDFYLSSAAKKSMVARFINPALCKITEDLVFTNPYIEHPQNRTNPAIAPEAKRLRADDDLRSEVLVLKAAFQHEAQALLHGDLHTGSIMANTEETRVVDAEFAFFGPIGFDIGAVLGNLALSYASQEWHAKDSEQRAKYRAWLLETMTAVWQIFEREFRALWERTGNGDWPSERFRDKFILRTLRQSAGFAACKMMRRILGLAHVPDLESIPDEEARGVAERKALAIAEAWLRERRGINSIQDMVDLICAVGGQSTEKIAAQ